MLKAPNACPPIRSCLCGPTSDVPCNDTAACPDGTTCCKTKEGGWACCPLPQVISSQNVAVTQGSSKH
uniref:Granulins domain-containing protein n=1 Tax=Sinocyclocheilus rhinocerous TaxID=307959 RepID=A0A673N7S4_9TELE